jgi:hypothetical protein
MGLDNDTMLTIMNIRERLMEYYKGTCVEHMTVSGNIAVIKDYNLLPSQHLYERQLLELENKRVMLIGRTKIFTLTNHPKKIVFYSCLDRSPQLREVKKEIEQFMHDFLGGVEVSYIKRTVAEKDDSELMKQTRLQDPNDGYIIPPSIADYFIRARPAVQWTTGLNTGDVVF